MNKALSSTILTMVLAFVSSVFAQTPDSTVSQQKLINGERRPAKEHRGFYNSMSAGFAYEHFQIKEYSYYGYQKSYNSYSGRDYDRAEFSGFTFPYMEFKFGNAVGNFIAFYTVFNFAIFSGSLDDVESEETQLYDVTADGSVHYTGKWKTNLIYNDRSKDEDALGLRTYVGFGTTIYPFMNKNSAMNGFFVGGSAGYSALAALGIEEDGGEATSLGFTFQVEIGKEWWVNDNLSIGVGFSFYNTNLYFESAEDSWDRVFALSFRMTRG